MFSLDGNVRYWLYNRPVDMRKSFDGLSAIVVGKMGGNLRDGDAFVFMNSSRKILKILRYEEGVLVMYAARIDLGRMHAPWNGGPGDGSVEITHSKLVRMISLVAESTYVRRVKRLAKRLASEP